MKKEAKTVTSPLNFPDFYILKPNKSTGGRAYTKLVRSDRSGKALFEFSGMRTKPQVGKRTRIKHRARTCVRVNRDING